MVGDLKLSTSAQCIKYLMFVFNLIFVITGIILLSIGSTVHSFYHEYEHFLDNRYFSIPTLLIVVGSIIFFVAFFGCWGAIRENYCLIITFASLMGIVFVLELFAGVYGYILRNDASEVIITRMTESMKHYDSEKEIYTVWDTIQTKFKCCGTKRPEDWQSALKDNNMTKQGYLPLSCCSIEGGTIGYAECRVNGQNLYTDSCLAAVETFVKLHAVQIGGFGLGIALVQALGIWFSLFLARSIKKSYINM